MSFVHVWRPSSLSAVLVLPLRDVRANATPTQMPPEGGRVVALVGIEFSDTTLGANPELSHRGLGADTVVSVTFGGYIREW